LNSLTSPDPKTERATQNLTSMLVLLIVGPKFRLAASNAAQLVSHAEYAPHAVLTLEKRWNRETDGRTDGRHTVTLRLPPDAANVKIRMSWLASLKVIFTLVFCENLASSCYHYIVIMSLSCTISEICRHID